MNFKCCRYYQRTVLRGSWPRSIESVSVCLNTVRCESCGQEFQIPIYITGNLSTFGYGNVFAVHQQKQRGGWKEHQTRCHNANGHCTNVTASLRVFYCSNRSLLGVGKTDVIQNN